MSVPLRMVRYILAQCESNNTIISRDKLTKTLRELNKELNVRSVPFAAMLAEINGVLGATYGYSLVGIESRGVDPLTPTESQGAKSPHFILLNTLPMLPHLEKFKLAQITDMYSETLGEEHDAQECSALDNAPEAQQEQVLRGITCLVVSLVLLSHNNILHHELAGHLRSYGIPDDGSEIPVLQYGLSQLLYVLERREYIARHEERSENEEVITVYRVGRRAVHEFGVDGLVKLVQEVMGVGELREEVERAAGIAAGSAGSAGSR